jgi:hypothetical protein
LKPPETCVPSGPFFEEPERQGIQTPPTDETTLAG